MDSGDELLIGGDELFFSERFVLHYEFMLKDYSPNTDKPLAFFMSCSKYKPYNRSPYRRVFNAMLDKKLGLKEVSQIYTISEPAIIVPEEFDETNITRYDFPPEQLQEEGREIFVTRLASLLPKLLSAHRVVFYILPRHHRSIFEEALAKAEIHLENGKPSKIIYAPPLTYNLPKARAIIEQTLLESNFKGRTR